MPIKYVDDQIPYHIVSLAAVFVALAVGAVFGTAATSGFATDVLSDSISAAHKTNEQLRQTTQDLQVEARRKDDYINDTAPAVLRGTLDNRRIVVLTTPSGRDHAKGVIELVPKVAGAGVLARPVLARSALAHLKSTMEQGVGVEPGDKPAVALQVRLVIPAWRETAGIYDVLGGQVDLRVSVGQHHE